jgi:hypothetical protein
VHLLVYIRNSRAVFTLLAQNHVNRTHVSIISAPVTIHFRFKIEHLFIYNVNYSTILIKSLSRCLNKIFRKISGYLKHLQLKNFLCWVWKRYQLVINNIAFYRLKLLLLFLGGVLLEWDTVLFAFFWSVTHCLPEVRQTSYQASRYKPCSSRSVIWPTHNVYS